MGDAAAQDLAAGVRGIDVGLLGHERVICCFAVDDVLVDPGPASGAPRLLAALGDWRPRALLLTHIHLDHAGASGTLVQRWPDLDVYVHERGARHVADPSRLLSSAARLYGDEMQRLWGQTLPVPEERIHPLAGGEQVLGFDVAYTPGHASHHVAYRHAASGLVFCGDVAGARIPPSTLVAAPTPPPDVDLPAWRASVATLRAWEPTGLGLSHFGLYRDVERHLDELDAELARLDGLDASLGREPFLEDQRRRLAGRVDDETREAYGLAVPEEHVWLGLERYWTRREEPSG
jgi:glyoxylase-like metal-dependent hydrolase (beta-lactamase superfamily II)